MGLESETVVAIGFGLFLVVLMLARGLGFS